MQASEVRCNYLVMMVLVRRDETEAEHSSTTAVNVTFEHHRALSLAFLVPKDGIFRWSFGFYQIGYADHYFGYCKTRLTDSAQSPRANRR